MSETPPVQPGAGDSRSGQRPVYSIGAVARMLGVDVGTLRTWEDRYAVVVPSRSPGGQRVYSRDDLEHLRFVLGAMQDGVGAADAHRLLGEEMGVAEQSQRARTSDKAVLILLAERDHFAAELVEYLLRTEGYDVSVAFGPDAAEKAQRDLSPDLSVVDLMISGGGLRLCQQLSRPARCRCWRWRRSISPTPPWPPGRAHS